MRIQRWVQVALHGRKIRPVVFQSRVVAHHRKSKNRECQQQPGIAQPETFHRVCPCFPINIPPQLRHGAQVPPGVPVALGTGPVPFPVLARCGCSLKKTPSLSLLIVSIALRDCRGPGQPMSALLPAFKAASRPHARRSHILIFSSLFSPNAILQRKAMALRSDWRG